jgi:iron complex outermembrane recepter protein
MDGALTMGLKGTTKGGLNWDVSNALGNNSFDFYGRKTFNASLNDPFKNSFDDGGFSLLQNTVNANVSKEFNTTAGNINIAFGGEYRYERYKLQAGEEASWKSYNSFVLDSVFDDNNVFQAVDTVYRAPGAQGFVGFQPADVANKNRNVMGAYIDAEWDISKNFLVDVAARFENYSDFGSTFNAKLATRIKASNKFSVRGSVSTGYRAPSLAQINYSSTFTNVSGGQIFDVKIASNNNALTKAAGISELKQERSLNASLGFTTKPLPNLSITVDAYWVQVKDRIVLSGAFSSSNPDLQYNTTLINSLNTLNVSQAQFFANAVNTTNTGIDVVIDYSKKIGKGTFKALLAGNIQKMNIDDINYPPTLSNNSGVKEVFFSKREQQYLISSAPPNKFALSLDYSQQKFSIGTRLTQFGKISLYGFGENFDGLNPVVPLDNAPNTKVEDKYVYNTKLTIDLYASAKLTKNTTLFFGCDNILNTHPDLGYVKGARDYAFNTEGGGAWDLVQMGINGRRVFMKLGISL